MARPPTSGFIMSLDDSNAGRPDVSTLIALVLSAGNPTASCPGLPDYPASERASGISGEVVLQVTISAAGEATQLEVAQGLGPAFDAVALEAARQCAFTAATLDGKPAASIIQLSTKFTAPLLPWTLEGEVVGELGEGLPGASVTFGGQSVVHRRPRPLRAHLREPAARRRLGAGSPHGPRRQGLPRGVPRRADDPRALPAAQREGVRDARRGQPPAAGDPRARPHARR